jgi:O-antigen ligase
MGEHLLLKKSFEMNPIAHSNHSHSNPYRTAKLFLPLTVVAGFLLLISTLQLSVRDVLVMALAAFTFLLALKNYGVIWLIFLLFLPFISIMAGMFGQNKINSLRVFLVVFIGLFFLTSKPRYFWPILFKNIIFLGLMLFFIANLVSAALSGDVEAVFRSVTYLEPLAFFMITYYVVLRRDGRWKTLLWVIGVGGLFVILLAFLEFAKQRPLVDIFGLQNVSYDLEKLQFYITENRYGLGGRISSILLQPVMAGVYFVIYMILVVSYILTYKQRLRNWIFILVPLCLFLVVLTGSRGPLLALAAPLLVYLAFNSKRGFTLAISLIGISILAITMAYLIPGIRNYLAASFNMFNPSSANFMGRINLTISLFNIFKMHPFFGYGPGLVQKAALVYMPGFEGLSGLENQYATVLADGGLMAFACYLIFIFGIFAQALKASRSDDRELHVAGIMMAALAAYYFTVTISVSAMATVGGQFVVVIAGGLVGLMTRKSQV